MRGSFKLLNSSMIFLKGCAIAAISILFDDAGTKQVGENAADGNEVLLISSPGRCKRLSNQLYPVTICTSDLTYRPQDMNESSAVPPHQGMAAKFKEYLQNVALQLISL